MSAGTMTILDGAAALARLMRDWECSAAFHVPGEGILEILDALDQAGVPLVSCRHEAGAAVAAQALGHVTGRPGICLVGRAPGALNTALALHTARTDAAPMILIIGQPPHKIAGREPFLGNDFALAFAPMAKWIGTCTEAARLPELFARAWATALEGQRGPVVLSIHEEVWRQTVSATSLPFSAPVPPRGAASTEAVSAILSSLTGGRKPLIVVGGTGWSAGDCHTLVALAERLGIPVATSYRRRCLMPASHPLFAGELGIGADPALARRVAEADPILVLGMRLGEINTFGASVFEGYRLLDAPVPAQRVLHVHPDTTELNAVYQTQMAVQAHPGEVLAQLLAVAGGGGSVDPDWPASLRTARLDFATGRPCPGPLDLREVFRTLRAAVPPDAMLTVGAGAYAHWPQRYFPHDHPLTQLGPKSGAMGYGLPAAIGVQVAQPGRRVVALAGDGCLMMQGEELSTAVLYRLPIVVIVVNNSAYGAIAASQTRAFGRTTGTSLAQVDLAAWAQALGATGLRVTQTTDFAPALERALTVGGPAVIELVTTEAALKP